MWARDVAGPVEPRWRRDWPTPGGGIRNDCQGPACRCPARGSRGTRGDRRAGLGAGGARGSRPATHLQGCGWGPSRAEPPGAGSGGLGVCAHWLPEVACHCNHPASVGDRVSAEGAASTGSPPPPPEDPGEQPGPALWRLRSGRLPPWPAVLAEQSWAGSRVRAGATCSARPGNVRLGQGEGGSRGCCLVTRPSCPRGDPAVPRPTSQCRGSHQVWARGHSHADTPCTSACPRSCTLTHTRTHTCARPTGARGLLAGVACWQARAQKCTPSDPGAPWARPARLSASCQRWPQPRRGSAGLDRGSGSAATPAMRMVTKRSGLETSTRASPCCTRGRGPRTDQEAVPLASRGHSELSLRGSAQGLRGLGKPPVSEGRAAQPV